MGKDCSSWMRKAGKDACEGLWDELYGWMEGEMPSPCILSGFAVLVGHGVGAATSVSSAISIFKTGVSGRREAVFVKDERQPANERPRILVVCLDARDQFEGHKLSESAWVWHYAVCFIPVLRNYDEPLDACEGDFLSSTVQHPN